MRADPPVIAGETHTGEVLVSEFSELVEHSDHLGLRVGEAAEPGGEDLDVELCDEAGALPGLNLRGLGGSVVRLVLVEDSHPVSRHGGVGITKGCHVSVFLLEILVLNPCQHGE